MKRRKVLFIQLSQIRLLAKKFAIVILFLSAFVMMLINKTDTVIIEKTSSMATDVVSPLIDVLVVPARTLAGVFDYFRDLSKIYDDNRKLRAENNRLQIVSDKARALEIENKLLAKLLNYTPPPNAKFVTARVIAEEGDAFSHSIIAYTGRDSGVKKGQVVMSDNGVIGRVDKPGKMYSKIILITDINSKIPVMVERTRVRGILSGDNTTVPKMIFIPLSAKLTVGDRIITSGVAGVFPPGLPIGKISSIEKNSVKIKTFGNLDRLALTGKKALPKKLRKRASAMNDEWSENLTLYFQRLLPLLFSLLLLFVSYIPLDLPVSNNIRPAVGMICTYFWLLHRPDVFNLLSVYLLGLTEDVISSAPFGSNIFALLVLYVLVTNLSRFFNAKPFVIIWYGFALLSLVTFLSRWLLVSVYYSHFLPLATVMFSYLVTAAAYPILSLINVFVQNRLMTDEE